MKIRILALSHAAGLLLAGALVATPANAQPVVPDEDFATRALNAQAATEAAAAARVQAAEQRDRDRAYQKTLQQHEQVSGQQEAVVEAQAEAYERELDSYTEAKERHERDARVYEETLASREEKNFQILTYPDQRLSELSMLEEEELMGKRVQDKAGKNVGTVMEVDIPHVVVKLNGGETVRVNSPRLRYDLDTHVVIADMSGSDLEKMPRATF